MEYAEKLTAEPDPITSPVAREPPSASPITPAVPSTSPPLAAFRLIPGLPTKSKRYAMADDYVETVKHNIYPLQFCNPLDPYTLNRRRHWDRYVHREGIPYFHHAQKQVVIFYDPYEDDVHDCVKEAVAEVRNRMRKHLPLEDVQRDFPTVLPNVKIQEEEWHYGIKEWELFVDIDVATRECSYWIADWGKQCVFWVEDDPDGLDENDPSRLTTAKLELNAPTSYDNARVIFTAQFWKHVEYFSEHRPLPEGAFEELKAWFLWGITDRLTGLHKSTIVREAKEMESFFSVLTSQDWNRENTKNYLTAVVARHWHDIYFDRAHNMFGEHTARPTREQSRYFESHNNVQPCFLARVLSFALLFDQPLSWYMRLCETWVDKTVFLDTWRDMIRDVHEEWGSMGFQATVILASNMGFLTIGPLGESNTAPAQVARTLSVVSTMMSIGSIMCSMLLSHDHRPMLQASFTLDGAQNYFEASKKHAFGLYGAAMMYSLPFSMFLWALIIFIAAILSFSFATWQKLSSPYTAFFTAAILLLVVSQTAYFWRGRREYTGSKWRKPESGGDSSKVAEPLKPGIEKQNTFGSILLSAVRRGSKLMRRITLSSLPSPKSPTKARIPSIPQADSDTSSTRTAVNSPDGPSFAPAEVARRHTDLRRIVTIQRATSNPDSAEDGGPTLGSQRQSVITSTLQRFRTFSSMQRDSQGPVLPMTNVGVSYPGSGQNSTGQSNVHLSHPEPTFIPQHRDRR